MNTLPDSLVRFEHELEEAIRRNPPQGRFRRSRRLALRLAVAGAVVAGIALGVLSLLPGSGPSVVDRAAAALATQAGTILHVDMTGRQVNPDGSVFTWEDESWQLSSKPFDRRQVEAASDAPRAETAIAGGVQQLYDASTDTVYTTPPAPPALQLEPGPKAGTKYLVLPKTDGTTVRKLITDADAAKIQEEQTAQPKMAEEPFRDEILALLTSGKAVEAGHTTVDGRDAIRIVVTGGITTYLVDASTYDPIRFETVKGGARTTLDFRVYEQLPAGGNEALLSLTAQHPGARVDASPDGYEAAQARLFPHG